METDETRIRNAAHLMVASLAGSLAHVTCKVQLEILDLSFVYSVFRSLLFVFTLILAYLLFLALMFAPRNRCVLRYQVSSGIHFRA